MVRFQVALDPAEAEALAHWAVTELRDPRDQIRHVLRQELVRRGLLTGDSNPQQAQSNQEDTDAKV